jgi:hypothetical protein
MSIFLALLLAIGGGASLVAQNSLPGDALYPVKLNINEEVRSWVALDSESRANWEIVLANRRLEEAEELAVEGELNAEVRAQIEENFQAHADRVQERIELLEGKDNGSAAEIASNLLASLKAHERILLSISTARGGEIQQEINLLNNAVKSESRETAEVQARAEAELSTSPDVQSAAEGRLNAAENKIEEVEQYIENKKDSFSATTVAQANARVDLAKSLVVQGEAKLESGDYSEAFVSFSKSHDTAQEAKLLLIALDRFEIIDQGRVVPIGSSNPSISPSVQGSTSAETNVNGSGSANSSGGIRIDLGF